MSVFRNFRKNLLQGIPGKNTTILTPEINQAGIISETILVGSRPQSLFHVGEI